VSDTNSAETSFDVLAENVSIGLLSLEDGTTDG
jgi:hypothetical protein